MTELYFTMEEYGKETQSRESKRRERQAGNPVYLLNPADMFIFIDKMATFAYL